MARSWAELLGEADARPEPEAGGGGMFARLRDSLGRSRRALTEQIAVATFDAGDEASRERLEGEVIAPAVGAAGPGGGGAGSGRALRGGPPRDGPRGGGRADARGAGAARRPGTAERDPRRR